MYRHILLPMDGSEVAVRAARTGIDLAAVHGARVTLLTCSVPYASFEADALLELQRSQYDEIARDVIVMGTHGRRSLAATMLGSQTLKVLAHCSIPVLVCR